MRSIGVTGLTVVVTLVVWEAGVRPQFAGRAEAQTAPAAKDNEELARMFAEDQADRQPEDGKPIDWRVVGPRDKERLAKARELYSGGKLATGADYYHTAMILQHSAAPGDHLLAHELCVVAVGKG